jgi:hypothetical protein
MKGTIKEWMFERPRVTGVLACGVRFPDKTALNESYSRDFPVVALDNVWRCVADAYQVLPLHRIPAVRMRWVYEKALLYCVRRSDGIILGLFTSRNPEELDSSGVERMCAGFEELRGSAT